MNLTYLMLAFVQILFQVQYVYYGLKEMCYLPELAQKEGASYDLYLKTISIVNNILIVSVISLFKYLPQL